MPKVLTYALIAVVAGFIGGSIQEAPALMSKITDRMDKKTEPAGFWSTPAIEGYGKIHYVDVAEFKPTAAMSNKIVFQLNKNEGDMKYANLGLERVARVVNLYSAAGVPLDKLHFVVSINSDAVPAALNNDEFKKMYGTDNPSLPLIAKLRQAGVEVTICDQSVAFHNYERDWIDTSVKHTLSSGTTVASLQNQGYAYLPL
ncbi:sulfur reduction protein DsrE [Enterobacterales bacterium CwR94]|nr:sulfur reduction protein DsrE [Enterobacterales bacterium CwR94]